ncbi:hypothetical protein WMZ97_12255 [Lentibacillus sp. N15]|uniref:hypothetical protein n=1 Tax=Lentibacillus songyuanensis TaxID=3136161 RepID=UPI0031BBAB3E
MHHVLEAKLVVRDMVFNIASEFIENESEDVEKQDCEQNAFYRMAKKLKHTFKRLPIVLTQAEAVGKSKMRDSIPRRIFATIFNMRTVMIIMQ